MSLVTVDIYATTHFVEQKKRASTTFSFWAFKFLFLYHMFLLPPLTGCKLCCLRWRAFINFLTLHFLCLFLTRASYTLPRSKRIQDPTNKLKEQVTTNHQSVMFYDLSSRIFLNHLFSQFKFFFVAYGFPAERKLCKSRHCLGMLCFWRWCEEAVKRRK